MKALKEQGAVMSARDQELVGSFQKRIAEAKEIEVGLRPVEELRAEIVKSELIIPVIIVAARQIEDGWYLWTAELSITATLKSFEELFPFVVPVVEISFAYLALHNIAILKGDTEKANEYLRKALKNIQDGKKYYGKITESPFATFNLVVSHLLLKNAFGMDLELGLTAFDLKEMLRPLRKYYVFSYRILGIELVEKELTEAVANWQERNPAEGS